MRLIRSAVLAFLSVLGLAVAPAWAQSRFLITDRVNHAIWLVNDSNHNNVIEEPGEVAVFFNSTNVAGTLAPVSPSCIGMRRDGLVAFGDNDSTRRAIYLLRDVSGDGDANDAGESSIVVDASNSSAVILNAPNGIAFDSCGRLYVCNAGAGVGADAIYRLTDLNGDGDFQDAGEIAEYVGVPYFGPGNGSYSPFEIVMDSNDVMYMHDSGGTTHGVYRFQDLNGNGRADDAGEGTAFFTTGNASGITITAGFAIDIDPVRPRSVYILQTASGPTTQQLYRLTDLNNDGDANDAGEAVLVWSTTEAGFIQVDVVALADGRVLVTDGTTATKRAILLTDSSGDGLFDNATERTTFCSGSAVMGVVRQMAPVFCPADWDRNKAVNPSDVASFVNDWFQSLGNGRCNGDFDFNGTIDPSDVAAFVNTWFAALNGGC